MSYFDTQSLECDVCGELIQPGEHYYKHTNGTVCCTDEECIKQALYDEHFSNEFKEGYIETMEEIEAEKADRWNDEMRDDGAFTN